MIRWLIYKAIYGNLQCCVQCQDAIFTKEPELYKNGEVHSNKRIPVDRI